MSVDDPPASISLTANRPRCVGTHQKATYPSSVKHDGLCLRHPLFVTYLRGGCYRKHPKQNQRKTPSEFAAFWPSFGVHDMGVWNGMVPSLTSINFENVQCLFGLQLTLDMFNSSTLWVNDLSELPPTSVILKGIASALNYQVWDIPLLHSLSHVDGSNISFCL